MGSAGASAYFRKCCVSWNCVWLPRSTSGSLLFQSRRASCNVCEIYDSATAECTSVLIRLLARRHQVGPASTRIGRAEQYPDNQSDDLVREESDNRLRHRARFGQVQKQVNCNQNEHNQPQNQTRYPQDTRPTAVVRAGLSACAPQATTRPFPSNDTNNQGRDGRWQAGFERDASPDRVSRIGEVDQPGKCDRKQDRPANGSDYRRRTPEARRPGCFVHAHRFPP
jgi:hypothetical protein